MWCLIESSTVPLVHEDKWGVIRSIAGLAFSASHPANDLDGNKEDYSYGETL